MPFSNLPNGDPNWITVLLIVLISAWGGTINYLTRLRKSIVEFSWVELLSEVFVSVFAGLIIGLFALASNAGPLMSMALAGIAGGHTVFYLDKYWGNKLKSIF